MNDLQTIELGEGDSFLPIGIHLKKQSGRAIVPWNLSDDGGVLDVEYVVTDADNVKDVVPQTAVGVTVTDADEGQIEIALDDAAVAVPVGADSVTRWLFVRIGTGGKWATFPPDGCKVRILVSRIGAL